MGYGRYAAFDGVGFGSRIMAYDGLAGEEIYTPHEIIPVKSKPKKSAGTRSGARAGGGTSAQFPVVWDLPFEITERGLDELVEKVTAFAESPELRTWASSVLSNEGRSGTDLSTDKALAEVLHKTVQQASFPLRDPAAKALYLAASMVAVGLPTAVVAHGEIKLTRALTAVHADSRWWYADPNEPEQQFGFAYPFLTERVVQVPPLASPMEDEIRALRVQLEEQRVQIAELQVQVAELLQEPIVVSSNNGNERVYKYVAIGALGLLALTLYLLYRKPPEDPDS